MVFVQTVVRSVINVPFTVEPMEFRGPDSFAVISNHGRFPNLLAIVKTNLNGRGRFANMDRVLVATFAVIIEPFVENHPRICRGTGNDRIDKSLAPRGRRESVSFIGGLVHAIANKLDWRLRMIARRSSNGYIHS